MYDWFKGVDSTIAGGFMAGLVVSILKVIRDGRRITIPDIAEAFICAIMAVGIVGILAYVFSVNELLSVAVGAFTATLGSKVVTRLALTWLKSQKDKAP